MISHSYRDGGIYYVVTTAGDVWETTVNGNVTRHREFTESEKHGKKLPFESLPLVVQKKVLKAMGVHPLLRVWYLYSPLTDLSNLKQKQEGNDEV